MKCPYCSKRNGFGAIDCKFCGQPIKQNNFTTKKYVKNNVKNKTLTIQRNPNQSISLILIKIFIIIFITAIMFFVIMF